MNESSKSTLDYINALQATITDLKVDLKRKDALLIKALSYIESKEIVDCIIDELNG